MSDAERMVWCAAFVAALRPGVTDGAAAHRAGEAVEAARRALREALVMRRDPQHGTGAETLDDLTVQALGVR